MENYDDVTARPDENGSLNLSFNSWSKVPNEVFQFSNQLLKLNLSNNKLDTLSADFGSLFLLQELNVSYNRIQNIDEAISQCIRLRHLNISNNKLLSIPEVLCKCVMLEYLLCQNNKLRTVTNNIENLPILSTLNISNNNLKRLPTALNSMATLKVLHCHGNVDLSTSIPPYLLRDSNTTTSAILWVLQIQKEYQDETESKLKIYQELEKLSISNEETILRTQEYLNELIQKVKDLEASHPKEYIKRKKEIIEKLSHWYQRWKNKRFLNKTNRKS